MEESKNIAVIVQNLVQFYSIKNGIDALVSKKYPVDIYVPINNNDLGFGNMFTKTYNTLISMGYSPLRSLDSSVNYKILLEPYPLDIYFKINYTYRLKYKYSLLSAKPNWAYKPENNLYYDAILSFSPYESDFLNVFSKIEMTGNLKYINLTKLDRPNTDKSVLLYLPTYGDVSSIDLIIDELKNLKSKYYIITKLHHGTSFLLNEKTRIEKLKSISDESYDQNIELAQLLSKVDVVLSDNSGAIFEALYAKVPIAIYSDDINKNKLSNINTAQYNLVKEGYIPYTNKSTEIINVLTKATTDKIKNKQLNIRNKLFYFPDDPINDFVKTIEKYLNDNIDYNYKKMHDMFIDNYNNYILNYNSQIALISDLQASIKNYEQELTQKNLIIHNYEQELTQKNLIIQKGIARQRRTTPICFY